MLSRIMLSVAMVIVLVAAPVRVSARTCILLNASGEKACQSGCCANKSCCATSQKNTAPASQLLAKSASGFELSATCVATLSAIAPGCVLLDRQLSSSRTPSCAVIAPQLAVLCTFLI